MDHEEEVLAKVRDTILETLKVKRRELGLAVTRSGLAAPLATDAQLLDIANNAAAALLPVLEDVWQSGVTTQVVL